MWTHTLLHSTSLFVLKSTMCNQWWNDFKGYIYPLILFFFFFFFSIAGKCRSAFWNSSTVVHGSRGATKQTSDDVIVIFRGVRLQVRCRNFWVDFSDSRSKSVPVRKNGYSLQTSIWMACLRTSQAATLSKFHSWGHFLCQRSFFWVPIERAISLGFGLTGKLVWKMQTFTHL